MEQLLALHERATCALRRAGVELPEEPRPAVAEAFALAGDAATFFEDLSVARDSTGPCDSADCTDAELCRREAARAQERALLRDVAALRHSERYKRVAVNFRRWTRYEDTLERERLDRFPKTLYTGDKALETTLPFGRPPWILEVKTHMSSFGGRRRSGCATCSGRV